MDFTELERLFRDVRAARLAADLPHGFELFDLITASDADFAEAEAVLGVSLPVKYREFMSQIGGGSFPFLDLLPVVARDGLTDDLVAANSGAWRVPGFVAVAPAGTGDWWAFPVKDGSCEESVVFGITRTAEWSSRRLISWNSLLQRSESGNLSGCRPLERGLWGRITKCSMDATALGRLGVFVHLKSARTKCNAEVPL